MSREVLGLGRVDRRGVDADEGDAPTREPPDRLGIERRKIVAPHRECLMPGPHEDPSRYAVHVTESGFEVRRRDEPVGDVRDEVDDAAYPDEGLERERRSVGAVGREVEGGVDVRADMRRQGEGREVDRAPGAERGGLADGIRLVTGEDRRVRADGRRDVPDRHGVTPRRAGGGGPAASRRSRP